jgi:hypothetical protein
MLEYTIPHPQLKQESLGWLTPRGLIKFDEEGDGCDSRPRHEKEERRCFG